MIGGEVDQDGRVGDVGEEQGKGEGDGEHGLLEAAPSANVTEDILEILDHFFLNLLLLLLPFDIVRSAGRFHGDGRGEGTQTGSTACSPCVTFIALLLQVQVTFI